MTDLNGWLSDIINRFSEIVFSDLAVFVAILALGIFFQIVKRMMGDIRRFVQSERERQIDLDSDQLDSLKIKIRKEKDQEVKKALQLQAEKLRARYSTEMLENLRGEDGKISEDWREPLLLARKRLVAETDRLSSRSSSNLAFGITIAVIGIAALVLIVFVFPPEVQVDSTATFLAQYGPRISIILIVEILAAFFLRMYSRNEKDIYRNKNEITNIELRLTAGLMRQHHRTALADISLSLAAEERNFLLHKSESAAPMDKNKLFDSLANAIFKSTKSSDSGGKK